MRRNTEVERDFLGRLMSEPAPQAVPLALGQPVDGALLHGSGNTSLADKPKYDRLVPSSELDQIEPVDLPLTG